MPESPDKPCPHCGALNELERETCWECYTLLSGHDRPAPKIESVGAISEPPRQTSPNPPFSVSVFGIPLRVADPSKLWWSAALALGGILISGYYLIALIALPRSPMVLPIDKAAEAAPSSEADRFWVTLTGGQWDCASVRHYQLETHRNRDVNSLLRGWLTEAVLQDPAGSVLVVATFNGMQGCDDIKGRAPSGFLYQMSARRRARIQEWVIQTTNSRLMSGDDPRLGANPKLLELCAFCGPGDYGWGVVLGCLFFASGLGLLTEAIIR